jgi:superoxide reductase
MAEKNSIYKCNVCGNVVSVLEAHAGTLVCCSQDMQLLVEKTAKDEGKEKHVPIIEIKGSTVKVKVGSIPHPMEEKHYIGLIQLVQNGNIVIEKRLKPGDLPEAEFCIKNTKNLKARAWCNVHGLWISS